MVQLTPFTAWAILLGLTMGVGLWSIVSLVPRLSRPRLALRVAPYLVDVSAGARELVGRRSIEPVPLAGAFLGPLFQRVRSLLGRVLGGAATIELRLHQSGSPLTVEGFRSQQLIWSLAGAAAGLVAALAIPPAQPVPPVVRVLLLVLGATAGLMLRDQLLARSARARLAKMSGELPTVLEFLTLSLSAGEGILDAIRRLSRARRGELGAEFARVISAVNSGVVLSDALVDLSDAVRLPALTRAIEQVNGALERGTPLAEVLRAQAQDCRDEAKRDLLETAGKKEVAMLIPLVFLILPITIVFALFPGVAVLQLGF